LRTQDGQVCVNKNLGIDADWLCSMARAHDEIVDPLCAFGGDAELSRRGTRPLRASLFVVVALSIVNRIVEPEANVYLGGMLGQMDDVENLLEALGQVLRRVVVAMWLGVPS
jgi:hypothetical protein